MSYTVTSLNAMPRIVSPHPEGDRTPVRAHLGIEAFGVNVYTGNEVGDPVIGCHDHAEDDDPQHEEVYVVLSGRAIFTLGDQDIDAPAGSFVYIPDLVLMREARAAEPATSILVVGAERGSAFRVSDWDTTPPATV